MCILVLASTACPAAASYSQVIDGHPALVDKQEMTMTTKTRLFALALAAATFTTASLVADTASARPRTSSSNAINKVHKAPSHAFIVRPNNPGGNGRKDNQGSDNSTSTN